MMNGPVVVGYDQTPHSDHALAEAAREAVIRGTALKIVHAYTWIPPGTPTAVPMQIPMELSERACREAAEQVVQTAAASVRSQHPGLTVEAHAVAGHPAKVLADASRGADLLVVGSRGRGGFTGLLLGSVSLRVLANAHCPVVVARGESRPAQGGILMAVDIEAPCEEILEYAFIEASRRGATLAALHVWDEPWIAIYGVDEDAAAQVKEITADYEARLDCLVRSWHARFPDVRTELRIAIGTAATALVEATDVADLIVVGGRHHGDGRHGMRVGPVANTVLHHSTCPVAVVPLG
jgi:nucleotide-binding universal stress UspA family protein